MIRILMLEDDPLILKLVGSYLSAHFTIDCLATYSEAEEYLEQFHYDVVLLDRNIDGEDIGMDLISKIKAKNSDTGVIVISAYDTISDKIAGLNLGADDYLDKPFDNEELLARINALARRNQKRSVHNIEGLVCDMATKSIMYEDKSVLLSKKESDLFFTLLSKRAQIVSKDELLDALYLNPQNISSNTIDATIKNIRKKLPVGIIKTIKTRGYIIEKGE